MKRSALRARGWKPAREAVQVKALGPRPFSDEWVAGIWNGPIVDLAKPVTEKPDPAYRRWVAARPCCASGMGDACSGVIVAHHAGKKTAKGRKAPDSTCIALCEHHHTGDGGIHVLGGPFKGWTRPALRAWQDAHIVATRARWFIDQAGTADGETSSPKRLDRVQ